MQREQIIGLVVERLSYADTPVDGAVLDWVEHEARHYHFDDNLYRIQDEDDNERIVCPIMAPVLRTCILRVVNIMR